MNTPKNKSFHFFLWVLGVALLCFGFGNPNLYAQEVISPAKNLKGFFQIDLSANVAARTVVEEIRPGVHAEGDAVSTRVLSRIAVKPWSPVEFYLQGGAADLDIGEFDDFRGDYDFAYGGGIRLMLYEYPGPQRFQFLLQGDTLHFATTDKILNTSIGPDAVEEEIRWREYTIQGIGIWRSYRWEPYLGARFSWLNSTDKINGIGELDLKADDNLGLVAGSTIYMDPRENFAVNFEVTLMDEASFKVGVRLWY